MRYFIMFWRILTLMISIPFAFAGSYLLLHYMPFAKKLLGHDRGRKFVEGSEVNIGKPTGVGIYFMSVFFFAAMSFCTSGFRLRTLLLLALASCIFGFLDDRSISPWKEFVKGMIDIGISVTAGVFAAWYLSADIVTPISAWIHIPFVLYALLAAILFIVSINATNATDGVDGLSGSLTVITIITLMIAAALRESITFSSFLMGLIMILVLLPYLWFNKHPSKVLMGDAGSRGIGFFIALYCMVLRLPFAYLIVGLPFMLDGGISILKITVGRMTNKKVILFKNIRTPLHDHLKKNKGFSIWKTYFTITGFAVIVDSIYLFVLLLIRIFG